MIRYSIIVPLYNEELVIEETYKRLTEVMARTGEAYELVFVNDGSRDKTEQLAKRIIEKDKRVCLINFSRNFGHQTAISARNGQCARTGRGRHRRGLAGPTGRSSCR